MTAVTTHTPSITSAITGEAFRSGTQAKKLTQVIVIAQLTPPPPPPAHLIH
ncbi:MAG: hypothetical protein LBK99_22050 [Opitutaceae bacterium]|nr:hypothetical protein [Opitutaceae bacterium]